MANTVTNTTVTLSQARVVKYITLSSDGTNETNTVLYDSSAISTTLGQADPLTCNVFEIHAIACVASTARIKLLFDASTPVLLTGISNGANMVNFCNEHTSGMPNIAASGGRTGDITLTTTGLASGDTITIYLVVRPA